MELPGAGDFLPYDDVLPVVDWLPVRAPELVGADLMCRVSVPLHLHGGEGDPLDSGVDRGLPELADGFSSAHEVALIREELPVGGVERCHPRSVAANDRG